MNRLTGNFTHLGSQLLHVVQVLLLVQKVYDLYVIVDLLDRGVRIQDEIIGLINILAVKSVFDSFHFQDYGVAQNVPTFLKLLCDLVPFFSHLFDLLPEEVVMLIAFFSVTIDAEIVKRSNEFVNAADSMPSMLFHHAQLAAFAVQGTCVVKADVLDGLMAVSFSLVTEVLNVVVWLFRTFTGECDIVEHGFGWIDGWGVGEWCYFE